MNTRTIDVEKCVGCGLCVEDCFNNYLLLKENSEGRRTASFKERGRCMECGHCNAICPQGAISGGKSINNLAFDDTLLRLMAYKRTVRRYIKGAEIEKDILEKILVAAQTAPTAGNRKSGRILLIKERLPEVYNKALDSLVSIVKKDGPINPIYAATMNFDSKREEILWNAEYMVIFVGTPSNIIDASISAERMQLEASKYNIGTAYRGDLKTGINESEEVKELLGMRKNDIALVVFAMGKASRNYFKPAIKENRKVELL